MKHLESHNYASYAQLITPTYIKDPLTESDILCLQDRFLTNGFHHIRVKNVASGRKLIKTFLQSLRVYHEIACVTMEPSLEQGVFDIFNELLIGQKIIDFEEFFVEEFYFDFMWIEATKELLRCPWFADFENHITDLSIDKHIPMFVLTYAE